MIWSKGRTNNGRARQTGARGKREDRDGGKEGAVLGETAAVGKNSADIVGSWEPLSH